MSPTTIPGKLVLQSPAANDPLLDLNTQPNLDLQFATNKTLNDNISGNNLITFSRGSIGTYVDSAGVIQTAANNVPRFDHDPTTGESLGLLVEEARTNLAENSDNFSLWTTRNATGSPSQGTAPDGTNTAFKVQEDTSTTTSHSVKEPSSSTWSGVATLSCYVKPAGRNFAYMGFTEVSQTSVTFDLVNKVSSYTANNVTSSYVEDAGNGWVRIVAVFSSSITSGPATVGPAESDSDAGLNYTGDGSSGILVWGAQLEVGAFPTSYIPTAGSTVTREADEVSITGTNFSSWFNQTEGTFFGDVTDGKTFGFTANDGSNDNRHGFSVYFGQTFTQISGVVTNFGVSPTVVAGSGKFAHGYKANDYGAFGDGVNLPATSPTTVPTGINELAIGYRGSFLPNSFINGHISRLTYYPYRLPDTKLQEITS